MPASSEPQRRPEPRPNRLLRRVAGIAVLSLILFAVLAYAMSSVFVAGMIAAAAGGTLLAGSSVSDVLEAIVEAVLTAVFAVIGAIGAAIAAVFSIFQ